ncbi:unnamed protein product [Lactuca saligna]|uniref:Uncharacterized protein n=1 Tax=Lactuca saligna TaxID=75948 RepID=A0AA35VG64_LACSI|nr:unnamed protein product [Lactuca saligna]
MEVEAQFVHEEGDEDLHEDVDFLKDIEFTWISDDLPSSIELNLDDDDFGPFPGFDNRCFKKVNEVAQPATKTGEDVNALKNFLSSSKPMEGSSSQRDVISEIPPYDSTVSTSPPPLSESTQTQTSQSPSKRSRSDSRLGVPSISQAPPILSTSTTTTVTTTTTTVSIPPLQSKEGPSTIFEAGGSSSIPEYSPTRPSLDEALIRLAKHLAQNNPTSSSRGKGYLSGKSIQVMTRLQCQYFRKKLTNLGSIIAFYFSLKNILYDAFGDKVKALFQQPHGIEDPPVDPTQYTHDDFPVDPPPPRTTTIVDRFDKEPENS